MWGAVYPVPTLLASVFTFAYNCRMTMQKRASRDTSLLEILQELSPESSKNTLRGWISEGRVRVQGERAVRADRSILEGQEVCVGAKLRFARGGISILYEDKEIVVLDKPSGLLSVATDFDLSDNVHTFLKRRAPPGGRVYPVHRLDRETAGVMLFAYTEAACSALKAQFAERTIEKEYRALVEGDLLPQEGRWQSLLAEDALYHVRSTTDPIQGKLAITHYKVLASSARRSLVQLAPQTGRKHQLRVHCADAGHPICGDVRYGATSEGTLALRARSIAFTHPRSGRRLQFVSTLAELSLRP
jgi:tRNA pseudouridine32 synthase/23S rRNA pseudouridine746 synthase/23S rRNA pseudouridine1911/1915/1917 synthase